MKMKRFYVFRVFLFLLVFAISSNFVSYSFTVGCATAPPNHENVLSSALAVFASGMSAALKAGLEKGDVDGDYRFGNTFATDFCVLDPDLWERYIPAFHWGGEGTTQSNWNDSVDQLNSSYQGAIDCLMNGDISTARENLGLAFHLVGDFFSHSNWIENKTKSVQELEFTREAYPPCPGWDTIIRTWIVEKDTESAPGFDEAWYDAVEMTTKQYHRFEEKLFLALGPSQAKSALADFGVTPFIRKDQDFLGETFDRNKAFGGTYEISWEHCGIDPSSSVTISLLKNGVYFGEIVTIGISERSYNWKVGEIWDPSLQARRMIDLVEDFQEYRIKITPLSDPDKATLGFPFAIYSWQLLSPVSNEDLQKGSTYTISWTSINIGGWITLGLYQDDYIGAVDRSIPTSSGSYVWTVGQYEGGEVEPGIGYHFHFGFNNRTYMDPPVGYFSPDFNIVLLADPIGQVENFAASAGVGKIDLSWTNPTNSGFTGTLIKYKKTSFPDVNNPNDGLPVADVAKPEHSYSHPGLSESTTYYYTAYAHDGNGNYAKGVTKSRMTCTNLPPAVTSIDSTPGDGQITLTWQNPGNVSCWTYYKTLIIFKTNGYPTSHSDGTLVVDRAGGGAGATDTFVHTGRTQGVRYYYMAYTHDNAGHYSTGVGVADYPSGITSVTNFNAQALVGREILLTWKNSTAPCHTGTVIRMDTTGYPATINDGEEVVDLAGSPGANESWYISGLTAGTRYYFSAFAHDNAGHYAVRVTRSVVARNAPVPNPAPKE